MEFTTKRGVANRLWRVPAYLPYLHPELTQDAINGAEEALGVRLPASYLDILRLQNGGYVRLAFPGSPHRQIWGIGTHFPNILKEHYPFDPENAEDGAWVPSQSRRLVPFDGDGHWYLCLDYRHSAAEPAVAYIDFEAESDRVVARTFAQFLDQLRLELPEPFFGVREASLDHVAEILGAQLKASFEPASESDHGYPIRRCRLGAASDHEWAWISPNAAPCGFIRPTDKRYEELRNALPGSSLRFPEFPDAATLIQSTPKAARVVREACARSGLPILDLLA